MLKVHIETVRGWVRSKRLVAYRVGRDYRVKKSDFERFLEERKSNRDE